VAGIASRFEPGTVAEGALTPASGQEGSRRRYGVSGVRQPPGLRVTRVTSLGSNLDMPEKPKPRL
jgi:hypothetical protein